LIAHTCLSFGARLLLEYNCVRSDTRAFAGQLCPSVAGAAKENGQKTLAVD